MKNRLAFVAAALRHVLATTRLMSQDAPLFRARCGNAGLTPCRAVAPRFAFDVRLDPRVRTPAQYVVVPVELLPKGSAVELDAFSLCETHTSLAWAVRRAVCLSGSADVARFDDTAYLAV
jgi:hypothetical protein